MDSPLAQTVITLLDRAGARLFVAAAIGEQDATLSWPTPSLARLRGTTLGAQPMPEQTQTRVSVRDRRLVPIPREEWITMRMEDQFDAALYLGPASTLKVTPPSPTICADAAYVETHLQRMAIAGLPPKEADRFRQLCGR